MSLSLSARPTPSTSSRGKRGGDRSSSLVVAAPSAQPRFFLPVDAAHLPRLRPGAFSSHPGADARDPLPDGFGLPTRLDGVGLIEGGATGVAANGKRIRTALGSDCLSMPRRRVSTGAGATGGGVA